MSPLNKAQKYGAFGTIGWILAVVGMVLAVADYQFGHIEVAAIMTLAGGYLMGVAVAKLDENSGDAK